MLRTVGEDGLDLGLVALLQLDDGPGGECGEHDGVKCVVNSFVCLLLVCDDGARIGGCLRDGGPRYVTSSKLPCHVRLDSTRIA